MAQRSHDRHSLRLSNVSRMSALRTPLLVALICIDYQAAGSPWQFGFSGSDNATSWLALCGRVAQFNIGIELAPFCGQVTEPRAILRA